MNQEKHIVVIGSGSIARRHISNLKNLWPEMSISCISASLRPLTREEVGADIVFASIEEAIEHPIFFAIIASPAPFHLEHAMAFLNHNIPVLIEKPFTNTVEDFKKIAMLFEPVQDRIDIAYNLRYMKSALQMKHYVDTNLVGSIYSVVAEVGQYLPHWRKDSDYRRNVSAQKVLGGGVLLELSHELDYLLWMFGPFDKIFCLTRNTGLLEIDVEDTVDAVLQKENKLVVNLHMDFLQHSPSRYCKMIGALGTLSWDLLNNQIKLTKVSGESILLYDDPHYDRNQMYLEELQHFYKVASGETKPKISLTEALDVMQLIEAMKKSSRLQKVILLASDNNIHRHPERSEGSPVRGIVFNKDSN